MPFQHKLLPGPAAYGNTVRLSYTGNTDVVPALTAIKDQNGDNPTAITIDKIEKVVNFSGANVSGPGSFTFGPGTWDLDESGGLIIPTPLDAGDALPGADNCIITVRGFITWATDHANFN